MHSACKYNKTRLYTPTGILLFVLLSICNAHANSLPNLLKQSGLELGGWINGGATYNANHPADGFNGAVTFADRANRFQLNQLNLFLQRNVESEGTSGISAVALIFCSVLMPSMRRLLAFPRSMRIPVNLQIGETGI